MPGKRRHYNRHGFQNFGGRKTGLPNPLDDGDISNLRQIRSLIDKQGKLSTVEYDQVNTLGDIVRYSLRKAGLITQHQPTAVSKIHIALTPRANALLAALDRQESNRNLPS